MKAAGLAQSLVHSAAAAAAAATAITSNSPFTPNAAGLRPINTFSTDNYDSPRESVVYTANRAHGAKRDSFIIGASVRMPVVEANTGRSRTNTEVEIEAFDSTEAGGFAQAEEHVHFFAGEDIDPSDFNDADLQLHYDEDKWETVSDSSDADILLSAEPGPAPVNEDGVINLTDDMLFNLRRYDELDLGIARVNPIALSMSVSMSQKVTFGGASSKFPHITPTAAASRKSDHFPQIASASAAGAAQNTPTIPEAPLGSPPQGSAPLTPQRPSTHSPGRNATARSLRKAMMNPDRVQAQTETGMQSEALELAVLPMSAGQAPSTAERGHTRGDFVAVRTDRLGPDVEVTRISTAEQNSKPLTPHTSKKGAVKLNFTRDAATTGAQGGLQGKSLGEPKGQVSFTIHANAADNYIDFDLDGFESLQSAVSEHIGAINSTESRKLSTRERLGSAKMVVTVPTAPPPINAEESSPSSPPKSIHGETSPFHFPEPEPVCMTDTLEVALFSADDATVIVDDPATTHALTSTPLETVDTVAAEHGLLVNTDDQLLLGTSADSDMAVSPFAIQLNVPVHGIDPLNNSMSPLFALYSGGAALYSERVTEIIEEQQRAKTAERVGTASRPATTHASRTATPALNTHTRTSDRGRPQTPPMSAEQRSLQGSSVVMDTAAGKSIPSLPYVRLAPSLFSHTNSQASNSIVFDDSLADESTVQLTNSSNYIRATAVSKFEAPADLHVSKLAPSSYQHDHQRVPAADKPRTTQEKLQAQFLHEMGLEYKQIFGAKGVLSPHKKRQANKHPSQLDSPLISNQEGQAATFSTAFPLRRAMYEKDVVQLRGANDEAVPVLVKEGHKGVGGIRPIDKERVYLRHQLDQYYQHIESSLRERKLVEEAQTQITARRIYDLVHQVSLLDAEEISRMKLQETIQRRWLSRGGNWKGKHKFRGNKSAADSSVQSEAPPESRQNYRQMRTQLISHGSAEGSILQGYNELIMGSEDDPGNGWTWLTGAGVSGAGGISIPTATITEEDYRAETAGTDIDAQERHDGVQREQQQEEGLSFNPLLPSEASIENFSALEINTDSSNVTTSAKIKRNKEKKPLTGKSLQFDVQSANAGRVLHSAGIVEAEHASYVHSQELQEELQRSVLDATAEQAAQEALRSKSRLQSVSVHNTAARNLTSPPQAKVKLFVADKKRNPNPQARKSKAPSVFHLPLQGDTPAQGTQSTIRDADTPSKRQIALTLLSAPVDNDRAGSAAPATDTGIAERDGVDHFPEDTFPYTDEGQMRSFQPTTSTQDAAEMLRMDSEYANYLRYGDIYTKSILAGVDTEKLSLHGSGLALPSASTHKESQPAAVLKFNPLISKRLYAVSAPQHDHLQSGAQLEETSGEIVLRALRKAIPTQQVELDATSPKVHLSPEKVLTPRRPAVERPHPKPIVVYVPPPVQDDLPVIPRLVVTASRPEGAVLATPVSPTWATLKQKTPRSALTPSKE